MLFEQKSRRKSSVEIAVYPYKSLTRHYFFIKISSMISSVSYKTCPDGHVLRQLFSTPRIGDFFS